jgi:Anti-sigma factor NepR
MTTEKPVPDSTGLSRKLDEARLRQQAIGVGLRKLFDEVVNEDVPDEFLDILRKADDRLAEQS